MGDRTPLLTPILQGRQQRGAQHQVIISPKELLTLRNGWNLSSGILVPVFPSSLPSPQAGCPCSMADEALGPSPIPSGTSGVLLGSLAPGIVWVTHTSASGDTALWVTQGWSRARLLCSSLITFQQDHHPSVLTVCPWSKAPRLDGHSKEASLGVPVNAPKSHQEEGSGRHLPGPGSPLLSPAPPRSQN